MTSNEYRNKFNDIGFVYRLALMIQDIKSSGNYDFLLSSLKDTEFFKTATPIELYKINEQISSLAAVCSGIDNAISEKEIFAIGEFDDLKTTMEDIGVRSSIFKCTSQFQDPFNSLIVEPDTIIEVQGLHFVNIDNMVSAIYTDLKTSSTSQKLIDLFSNGEQKTALSLQILEKHFRPMN